MRAALPTVRRRQATKDPPHTTAPHSNATTDTAGATDTFANNAVPTPPKAPSPSALLSVIKWADASKAAAAPPKALTIAMSRNESEADARPVSPMATTVPAAIAQKASTTFRPPTMNASAPATASPIPMATLRTPRKAVRNAAMRRRPITRKPAATSQTMPISAAGSMVMIGDRSEVQQAHESTLFLERARQTNAA